MSTYNTYLVKAEEKNSSKYPSKGEFIRFQWEELNQICSVSLL